MTQLQTSNPNPKRLECTYLVIAHLKHTIYHAIGYTMQRQCFQLQIAVPVCALQRIHLFYFGVGEWLCQKVAR